MMGCARVDPPPPSPPLGPRRETARACGAACSCSASSLPLAMAGASSSTLADLLADLTLADIISRKAPTPAEIDR